MVQNFSIMLGKAAFEVKPKSSKELELFYSQFYYGHREILIDYLGVDKTSYFLGVLQHGVRQYGLNHYQNNYCDFKTPRLPNLSRSPLWVYAKETKDFLIGLGAKNVYAIGAPWNYLPGQSNQTTLRENSETRTAYLVFPTHYQTGYPVRFHKADLDEKINKWRELALGNPLTVCLFWAEYLDPTWQLACKEQGVSVVCAGMGNTLPVWSQHVSRIDFLITLREILSSHTHCIFEAFSSGIFYAISMGLRVGYFPEFMKNVQWESNKDMEWVIDLEKMDYQWAKVEMPQMIEDFAAPESLLSITSSLLGVDCVKSRGELATIMGPLKKLPNP